MHDLFSFTALGMYFSACYRGKKLRAQLCPRYGAAFSFIPRQMTVSLHFHRYSAFLVMGVRYRGKSVVPA